MVLIRDASESPSEGYQNTVYRVPRTCNSNEFLGDAEAVDWGPHFGNHGYEHPVLHFSPSLIPPPHFQT